MARSRWWSCCTPDDGALARGVGCSWCARHLAPREVVRARVTGLDDGGYVGGHFSDGVFHPVLRACGPTSERLGGLSPAPRSFSSVSRGSSPPCACSSSQVLLPPSSGATIACWDPARCSILIPVLAAWQRSPHRRGARCTCRWCGSGYEGQPSGDEIRAWHQARSALQSRWWSAAVLGVASHATVQKSAGSAGAVSLDHDRALAYQIEEERVRLVADPACRHLPWSRRLGSRRGPESPLTPQVDTEGVSLLWGPDVCSRSFLISQGVGVTGVTASKAGGSGGRAPPHAGVPPRRLDHLLARRALIRSSWR